MANILDIYSNDPLFSLTNLQLLINEIPYYPTKIGKLGLFRAEGIDSLTVLIEKMAETNQLVKTAPRGAPGSVVGLGKANVRALRTVHLPQRTAVMADEVQGVREIGTTTVAQQLQTRLRKKVEKCRQNLDLTHEWQRIGALKGLVLDADLNPIYDLFAEFGVTQITHNMGLDNTATDVLQKCVELHRKMEDELGGTAMSGIRVECDSVFMDKLARHPQVVDAWKYHQAVRNTQDYRGANNGNGGFVFGDIEFSEYRGKLPGVSGNPLGTNVGYAIPMGVPDQFITYFSPAPYMDTVNTEGLPFYMSQERLEHNKGIDVECQSNPLHLNTRPRAVIKLSPAV